MRLTTIFSLFVFILLAIGIFALYESYTPKKPIYNPFNYSSKLKYNITAHRVHVSSKFNNERQQINLVCRQMFYYNKTKMRFLDWTCYRNESDCYCIIPLKNFK